MTSPFPNALDSFTPKRDGVDVNYAADINRLQDAVSAIEQTIGALITTVSDVITDVNGNEEVDTQKFTSLAQFMDLLFQGEHIRASQMSSSGDLIPPINNAATFQSTMPRVLLMDKPIPAHDPYYQWNQGGVTLTKGGFWLLIGHVRYDMKNPTTTNNAGIYQAALECNGNWTDGLDRKEIVADGGYWPNVFLNPIRMGWFTAGTLIRLRTSQSSALTQTAAASSLSAVWMRSPF